MDFFACGKIYLSNVQLYFVRFKIKLLHRHFAGETERFYERKRGKSVCASISHIQCKYRMQTMLFRIAISSLTLRKYGSLDLINIRFQPQARKCGWTINHATVCMSVCTVWPQNQMYQNVCMEYQSIGGGTITNDTCKNNIHQFNISNDIIHRRTKYIVRHCFASSFDLLLQTQIRIPFAFVRTRSLFVVVSYSLKSVRDLSGFE